MGLYGIGGSDHTVTTFRDDIGVSCWADSVTEDSQTENF